MRVGKDSWIEALAFSSRCKGAPDLAGFVAPDQTSYSWFDQLGASSESISSSGPT